MIKPLLVSIAALSVTAAAPVSSFDPLAFFSGASRGEGSLKVLFKEAVPVRVQSLGTPDGKGGIVLRQIINEGAKPARERLWTMRPTSATTLTGTITDTPGLVEGRLRGNQLLLSYTMKGGLHADQVLTLQPGGRSVINRMTIRKLGMTVARVEERITKSE